MNQKIRNRNLVIILIVGILLLAFLMKGFFPFALTPSGSEITLKVPHLAGLKCEPIDKSVQDYTIPKLDSGIWISKQNIGFKSKVVDSIVVSVSRGFWENIGSPELRVIYVICDSNKLNCGNKKEVRLQSGTKITASLPSIDVSLKSINLRLEKRGIATLFQWKISDGGVLSYSAEKYGLNLYSTTGGFRTVCQSSCNLNCPDIGVRKIIVDTPQNDLGFYQSTNYIEFWEDVKNSGEQFGGTIYNIKTNQFCFGGFIYNTGVIKTETGDSFTYPKDYVRKQDCCNGATATITNGQKICEEGVWREIKNDENIQCTSSIECPAQGIYFGQHSNQQNYKARYECKNNICVQSALQNVQCIPPNIGCAVDQVCENFVCKGGAVGGLPGANNSGQGGGGVESCVTCDAYARSKLFGWIDSLSQGKTKYQCNAQGFLSEDKWLGFIPKPRIPQNQATCSLSFIKYFFVPIVFIISLLFGAEYLNRFRDLKGKNKKRQRFLVSLIIGIVLAWLTFFMWWIGLIALGIIIIIKLGFVAIGGKYEK